MEIADVITPGQADSFKVGARRQAASLEDLEEVHRRLLDQPVTATLGTIPEQGSPQLTPVWCNRDGDTLNLNSVRDRTKDRNLRARPDVSLLFINPENPYHWLTVYGRVVEIIDEDDPDRGHLATENIDDLAESYLGQRPYPLRDPVHGEVRVLYRVDPTKVVTFGPVE